MDQVTVPVGATPPIGPETVAVKIKEEPSAVEGALVVITTEGVTFETTML